MAAVRRRVAVALAAACTRARSHGAGLVALDRVAVEPVDRIRPPRNGPRRPAPTWWPAGRPARRPPTPSRSAAGSASGDRPDPTSPYAALATHRPGRPARAHPRERRRARLVPQVVALRLAAGHRLRRRRLRPDRAPAGRPARAQLPAGGAGARTGASRRATGRTGRGRPMPAACRRTRPAGCSGRVDAVLGRRAGGPTGRDRPERRAARRPVRRPAARRGPPGRVRCPLRAATTGSSARPG